MPNNFSANIWRSNPWENCPWWLSKACLCNIFASEHYQSGPHICHAVSKLVLCRTPWIVAYGGFCYCSACKITSQVLATLCFSMQIFFNFPYEQIATLIAVYANWSFAAIEGIGWRWAGVIWLYNLIFYIPLDFIKFFIRYALSGRAWDLVIEQRVWSTWYILICGTFFGCVL